MSNLQNLINRYEEGDKMSNLEMLVIIARDDKAADELEELEKCKKELNEAQDFYGT